VEEGKAELIFQVLNKVTGGKPRGTRQLILKALDKAF
jgi:hypothetical protein